MVNLTKVRGLLPDRLKYLLKPYFRTLVPNQLIALIWITFRCNYRCSYCNIVTNFDFGSLSGRDSEKSADEWLLALDRLPSTLFYFAGGEPFLYKELPELINRLPSKHSVIGVVSNGTAKIETFKRLKKRIGINISFHREFIEEEPFIKKISELKDVCNVSVNIVATKENLAILGKLKEKFKENEITLHVDRLVDDHVTYTNDEIQLLDSFLTIERRSQVDQLNYSDYGAKLCNAGKNYINIFPNGDTYTCAGGMEYRHSPLVSDVLKRQPGQSFDVNQFAMGNLFDPGFHLNSGPLICTLPCRAACDRDFTSYKRL